MTSITRRWLLSLAAALIPGAALAHHGGHDRARQNLPGVALRRSLAGE